MLHQKVEERLEFPVSHLTHCTRSEQSWDKIQARRQLPASLMFGSRRDLQPDKMSIVNKIWLTAIIVPTSCRTHEDALRPICIDRCLAIL